MPTHTYLRNLLLLKAERYTWLVQRRRQHAAKYFKECVEKYEKFLGIKEVDEAQERVLQAESNFILAQECRRRKQLEIDDNGKKLKDITNKLDNLQRGDEKYLQLLTEEHGVLKLDIELKQNLTALEEKERASFTLLSNALRSSHEKERTRSERTKYWGLIGSVSGAVIGIIGTSINHYRRNYEMKLVLRDMADSHHTMKSQLADILSAVPEKGTQVAVKSDAVKNTFVQPRIAAVDNAASEQLDVLFQEQRKHLDTSMSTQLKWTVVTTTGLVIALVPLLTYLLNRTLS